ncbi:cytochrome c-type biogenesis protein CcmH [Rodentibacter caecimuris]|uniref:cytochrome c-type biogenesis protein n=1 Tax=Rodentibacter caecimuris TaxID=1796644 RepID=UPI0015C3D365
MKKIVFFLTIFGSSILSQAAIDVLNFRSQEQEDAYHQLTQGLRCPQCQNNNIADSNATIAVDMRAKVFELLEEGKSQPEIIEYMVQRYGHFVTYDPPLTTATIILWIAPIVLVVLGLFFIFNRRKNIKSAAVLEKNLSEEEQDRLQQLLDEKER